MRLIDQIHSRERGHRLHIRAVRRLKKRNYRAHAKVRPRRVVLDKPRKLSVAWALLSLLYRPEGPMPPPKVVEPRVEPELSVKPLRRERVRL